MNKERRVNWPGMGLVSAGVIVFLVGLMIILFKEFDIPRYYIVAVIGFILIVAGIVVNRFRTP